MPTFWTEDLRGGRKDHDARFANALRLTKRLIADDKVDAIGIEAPILSQKSGNSAKHQLLMGLVGCIRGWASIKGIHCEVLEISHIDVTFLGARQRSGRDARKAALWNMCRARGWNPKTQDEADAASAWDTMCVHMSPSYAARSGSLLSGRVG